RLLVPPLALFALLSGADLFLTWRLLGQGLPSIAEGNPVAAWVLGQFGWAGLSAFKAAAVVSVGAAAVVIATRRPRLAVALLSFGCVALASVVWYSARFRDVHHALGDGTLEAEVAQLSRRSRLENEVTETARLTEFKRRLADEVVAGRLGFRAAVDR